MMRSINDVQTVYIVEYMTEASEVREYVHSGRFNDLLDEDRKGTIHILKQTEVQSLNA